MADTTPYVGLSPSRLTELINQDNNSNLQLGVDFTFGAPSGYSDAQGRNTQVTMTPVPGTNWPKPETVHYTRLALTILNDLPVGWVQPVAIPNIPFTLANLLDRINVALGINLTQDEIVNTVYTTPQSSYRLPINESISLAWIDSDYEFPASLPGGDIPLAQAITNNVLNGLTYLQPA